MGMTPAIGIAVLAALIGTTDLTLKTSSAPFLAQAGAPAGSLQALATGEMRNFTLFQPPKPVAEAEFYDGNDEPLDLGRFKGKVVLVNLWATWCAPCRAEMPALDRLAAELGGADLAVVAIAEDRGATDKARAFLEEVGVRRLELYVDHTMSSAHAWGVVGLPTSLLIGRDGKLIGQMVGPAAWDSPEAKALIRAAIAGGTSSG